VKSSKREKADTFFYYIKNIFMVLLFLSIAPTIISSIKTTIVDSIRPKTDVGLLKLDGALYDSSYYLKKIEAFSKDDSIKGLIIKINSPGGMPGSAQAIFAELKKLKKRKPVIAVVENICASGAYYVATAADKIIANPSALVGSVGVILELPNVKDLLNSWKIKYSYIQSGKYKTAGSPLKETSGEETAYLQKLSDSTYAQFVKDVAESRNLSEKDFTKWADGKIFTGTQALELKLIDQLGTIQDGIDVIKKLAKIETEVKLIQPKKRTSLLKMLTASDDEEYGIESHSFAESTGSFISKAYSTFMQQQAVESNSLRIE
jgi:protease IV